MRDLSDSHTIKVSLPTPLRRSAPPRGEQQVRPSTISRSSPAADGSSSPTVRRPHLEREEEGNERLPPSPAHFDNGRRVSDGCQGEESRAPREGIGGRRGIMVSSARHQPPTAVIARRTTVRRTSGGGYGCCFECVRKADEDGEVPVDRGPGVCGGLTVWVVCDCDC